MNIGFNIVEHIKEMKQYTLRDLQYDICGEKFILPNGEGESEEKIIEQIINGLDNVYERRLYTDRVPDDKVALNEYGEIEAKCLYEGYDEYYRFDIVLRPFFYKHKDGSKIFSDETLVKEVTDGQVMTTVECRHEYNGLFDQLLDEHVFPSIIKELNLKKYYYKFF